MTEREFINAFIPAWLAAHADDEKLAPPLEEEEQRRLMVIHAADTALRFFNSACLAMPTIFIRTDGSEP